MGSLKNALKPEYVFRPRQALLRLLRSGRPPETAEVQTAWGLPMSIRPKEVVGMALYHLGVYDLSECELIWRLSDPGETVVDVGANVGAVTGLFAVRVGPGGTVHAFEPHPTILETLTRQVDGWESQKARLGSIRIHGLAASDKDGEADLFEPEEFSTNTGIASLAHSGNGGRRHRIQTRRLDSIFPADRPVGVFKLDAEGHEPSILEGCGDLLRKGTIRDILFEEHEEPPTPATRCLEAAGYTVFLIGRSFGGPELLGCDQRDRIPNWLAPNYLATRDPERAKERCRARGWKVLG
jgi:FkbM family methyltransferase